MRNFILSLAALGSIAGIAVVTPAVAQPIAPAWSVPGVQRVQYYEPDWREREEWRRRREIEFRQREQWRRREEWRRSHEFRGPPPPPYYGPRY